jgi:catechol 2,3-dioxygenase-like lactoylglutathione lyase family enzyme
MSHQSLVVSKRGLTQVTPSNRKAGCDPAPQKRLMKILSIDHVQIAMPVGEEQMAHIFYMELLGFTEIPKPPELAKRGGAWFQSESVQLHLGVESDFRPARKAHPAFIVDDLDSLLTKIQDAGYETDSSQPPLNGYKRAHVFDPFGNRIELMERLE